jgi:type IV secretory pathway TrbD component
MKKYMLAVFIFKVALWYAVGYGIYLFYYWVVANGGLSRLLEGFL